MLHQLEKLKASIYLLLFYLKQTKTKHETQASAKLSGKIIARMSICEYAVFICHFNPLGI